MALSSAPNLERALAPSLGWPFLETPAQPLLRPYRHFCLYLLFCPPSILMLLGYSGTTSELLPLSAVRQKLV